MDIKNPNAKNVLDRYEADPEIALQHQVATASRDDISIDLHILSAGITCSSERLKDELIGSIVSTGYCPWKISATFSDRPTDGTSSYKLHAVHRETGQTVDLIMEVDG